jgi:hypothetical protein
VQGVPDDCQLAGRENFDDAVSASQKNASPLALTRYRATFADAKRRRFRQSRALTAVALRPCNQRDRARFRTQAFGDESKALKPRFSYKHFVQCATSDTTAQSTGMALPHEQFAHEHVASVESVHIADHHPDANRRSDSAGILLKASARDCNDRSARDCC